MKIKVNNQTIDLGSKVNGLYSSIETLGSSSQSASKREVLKINFPFNKSQFDKLNWIDFTKWSTIIEESYWDEEEHQTKTREVEFDRSEYCLVCDIVEHQDTKNITIYIGKYNNEELLESTINDLLNT